MHIASGGRVVGADGKEGDIDRVAPAYFLEAVEVGGVATVKNRSTTCFDEEAAKPAMGIVQHPRAPMAARSKRDLDRAVPILLPIVQFMDAAKTEVMHQIADLEGDDDRLIRRHPAQRFSVEVIEMGVGHQHQVDGRHIMQTQTRLFHALKDLQPLCPVWIDQQIEFAGLDEKGRMANPGEPDLSVLEFGKIGRGVRAKPRLEEGGDQHLGQEIAALPASLGLQSDSARGSVRSGELRPMGFLGLLDLRLGFAVGSKWIGHCEGS